MVENSVMCGWDYSFANSKLIMAQAPTWFEANNCVYPMESMVGDNGETSDQALGKRDGADCRTIED
jgi:hypothetical protein